ncbi:MAG TPA: hypothetical protein VF723_16700 [Pyrinomonadaceae bacterium]|jgi:hypothetical protein
MSITEQKINAGDEGNRTRRIIFAVFGLIALLLIGALVLYLTRRPATPASTGPVQQHLEGAIRAGSPEFEKYRDLIRLDQPDAFEADRVAGDIVMDLTTTVRNFTDRTISGLEMRGTVVDLEGKPIKERTVIIIPSEGQPELENSKTTRVKITIPGFSKTDVRANIKMEVTGFKFK